MNHDSICPQNSPSETPSSDCCCDLLARAREDERKQAIQAIQAELIGWRQETRGIAGKFEEHAWRAYLGGLEDAINFVMCVKEVETQ